MRQRRARPPVDPTDAGAAWTAALARLGRQPLPRALLGQRLQQLGDAAETVEGVLDRAAKLGYLDDQAYAEALARRRSRTRGQSLIARELRSKGIPAAELAHAMAQLDPNDEEAQALALAQSSLRQRPPATVDDLRRRVGAVLGRRGYRTSTIVRVATRLRSEWELVPRERGPEAGPDD
jgi:regulatory protein